MNVITQDMKYRQSLLNFAIRHGVIKASRKYNKARSYIYFWLSRYDGSVESLACKSRRPHNHPSQHTPEEIKLLRDVSQESEARSCGTMVPITQEGLCPLPQRHVQGTAQVKADTTEGEEAIHPQTL